MHTFAPKRVSTNIAKENKEHRFNFNAADQELGTAVSADHDI